MGRIAFGVGLTGSCARTSSALTVPVSGLKLCRCIVAIPNGRLAISGHFDIDHLTTLAHDRAGGPRILIASLRDNGPVRKTAIVCCGAGVVGKAVRHRKRIGASRLKVTVLPTGGGVRRVHPMLHRSSSSVVAGVCSCNASHSKRRGRAINLSLFASQNVCQPKRGMFFGKVTCIGSASGPRIIAKHACAIALQSTGCGRMTDGRFGASQFNSFGKRFAVPTRALDKGFALIARESHAGVQMRRCGHPAFGIDFLPLGRRISFNRPIGLANRTRAFSNVGLRRNRVG